MCNVGNLDQKIRFSIGVVALIAAFFVGSMVSTLAGFIVGFMGALFMAIAIFRVCPLYWIFKINTNK